MKRDLIREHPPLSGVMEPTPADQGSWPTWVWEHYCELDGCWVDWDYWGLYAVPTRNGGQLLPIEEHPYGDGPSADGYIEADKSSHDHWHYLDPAYGRPWKLGENDDVWWVGVAVTGWGGQPFNYNLNWACMGVFSVDKETYQPTFIDSHVIAERGENLGSDFFTESYFQPQIAMWNETTGVYAWPWNKGIQVGNYSYSALHLALVSFDFNPATGAVTNITLRHDKAVANADQWEASVGLILGDSPAITPDGIVYAITNSPWGSAYYRDASVPYTNRAGTHIVTLEPDNGWAYTNSLMPDGTAGVPDIHVCSWVGAMAILPVDGGFIFCSAPHRDEHNAQTTDPYWEDLDFMRAVQGSWQVKHFAWSGGGVAPTLLSRTPFKNFSYMTDYELPTPSVTERFSPRWALNTAFFGGPTSGVLITYMYSSSFRVFDWEIVGGVFSMTERGFWFPYDNTSLPYTTTPSEPSYPFMSWESNGAGLNDGWHIAPANWSYLPGTISLFINPLDLPDEMRSTPGWFEVVPTSFYDTKDWP